MVEPQPTSESDQDHDERIIRQRKIAWKLSPLRWFVMVGAWAMLAVNLLLWGYYVIPRDTSGGAGSCEASSTQQYSLPEPGGATAQAPPASAQTTAPTSTDPGILPVLTNETRAWNCRQPEPSGIVTTAAIVLGLFLIPQILFVFPNISLKAGPFTINGESEAKPEVLLTNKNAQQAAIVLAESPS